MPLQPIDAPRAVVRAVGVATAVRRCMSTAVIGPLFLTTGIGGVIAAAAISQHGSIALGFGSTIAVAYWISVVHGLFGVREVAGGWPEIVAETAGYAVVVVSATAATTLRRRRSPNRTGIANRAMPRYPAIGARMVTSPSSDPVLQGRMGP